MKDPLPVNLHLVINNFKNDSRVLRETKSIADSGNFEKIRIVAFWENGLKEREQLDDKRDVWRVRLRSRDLKKYLFTLLIQYIEWTVKIVAVFRKENIKVIHCHDLPVLPIGIILKLLKKTKLVYDAHELETEISGLYGIRKKLSKVTEKLLIRYADAFIVVSDSISQWYKNKYSLNDVHIIRNIPYSMSGQITASSILKDKFNLGNDEILFIYQGFVSRGKNIEALLDVFSRSDRKKHLVIMGYGPLVELVRDFERNFPNIHFQEAVESRDVLNYTRGADVGIHIIGNTCLNHYYCLPNKVFEYILSGIPLVVSDFPDMGRVIDDHNCGWKVDPGNKDQIFQLVNNISLDDITEKRAGVQKCREEIVGWEREEIKLKQLYQSLT